MMPGTGRSFSGSWYRRFVGIRCAAAWRRWARRFRAMMKAKGLTYDEVARLAGFKNGNVVKATVTRGLPHFARLLVVLWEEENTRDNSAEGVHESVESVH